MNTESILLTDGLGRTTQACMMPNSDTAIDPAPIRLTPLAGAGATSAALPGGLYRVVSDVEVHIVQGAAPVAAATHMTIPASPHVESWGVVDGNKVSVWNATAGAAVVELTRMPSSVA